MREWVLPYVKQHKLRMMVALLFAFLGVVSAAMLLFVSGYLISKSALRPENIMIVYVPIVAVRAFSIGQAVFPYLEKLISHDIVLRILAKYRNRLYTVLEPQAVFLESRYQTGDLLSVLSDDIEKLQDFYLKTLLPSLLGIVVYVVIALVFGFFDAIFMVMIMTVLGIILFVMPFVSYYMMKKRHLRIKQSRTTLYQRITDAMFGQLDWLVSGREHELLSTVQKENETLLAEETRLDRWQQGRETLMRFVGGCAILLTMYWAALQVDEDAISPTLIAAFVLMIFSILDTLMPVSDAVEEMPEYTDAINRLNELEANERVKQNLSNQAYNKNQKGWSNEIGIHLQHVSFTYEGGNAPVLEDFSLQVEQGSKLAILGKSGSGKSTLLKLISGLIQPDQGEVRIGEVSMHRNYLGSAVSVLNQDAHLFHTTVANNVRIGRPSATDEEVINALYQAQMMELLRDLPQGIHTQMDEMGKRFSGGERQRIVFARVLLQNSPIIILDEPATGLDPKTEQQLLRMMLTAAKDKTVIMVTHHLAGAELMDEILFLESGSIKLKGTHVELMRENPYYRKLYAMDEGLLT